jgi:arylformamidase
MALRVYDISVPVGPGMLHYGRQPEKTIVESMASGDPGDVSRWLIGSHTGTHLDAPAHFDPAGATIDELAIERFVGLCRVLDLTGVAGTEISADDLVAAGLAGDERVLLKTANSASALQQPVKGSWVGLDEGAARLLVERGVRLVGIDYLTIDSPAGEKGWPVHNVLCPAGVIILEVIDLRAVPAGPYLLAALPVPLVGSEAAFGRAVLLDGVPT